MKPCKAKLSDEKSCPNQVDEGQEYCPFHLAIQNAKAKKILSFVLPALGLVATGIFKLVTNKKG